jgi:tRNA dimethylallyltransferase
MAVARKLSAEILCVDSMTVYRHMDIGTAKPTPADRAEIPHHGLDLVEPTEEFTVARFVELADRVIADCRSRGKWLIAVGGTPLYFMSLFRGLFEGPPADEGLRQQLRELSPEALHAQLRTVDPVSAERLHANDQKRVIRAIEVFRLTGRPLSELQTEWSNGTMRHTATWFSLDWDKEVLNRRINARAREMIRAGWVDEVRRLPPVLSRTAGEASGYREIRAHLAGRQTLDDALEAIKIATRQLARRQMKWFRRWSEIRWLRGETPTEQNVQAVIETLPIGG